MKQIKNNYFQSIIIALYFDDEFILVYNVKTKVLIIQVIVSWEMNKL